MLEAIGKRLQTKVSSNAFMQILFVIGVLLWAFGRVLWWLVKDIYRLLAAVTAALVVMAWVTYGWVWGLAVLAWPVLPLAGWWLADRQGCQAWFRLTWRYWTIYRGAFRDVQTKYTDPAYPDNPPKIESMTSNHYVDTLTVHIPPMQKVGHYARKHEEIAQTLKANGCRAVQNAKSVQLIDLWLWHDDPLTEVVRPHEPPSYDDPFPADGFPTSRKEDGSWYRIFPCIEPGLPALEHMYGAGQTGSGKSGMFHSAMQQLSTGVEMDLVKFSGADPKGGMELGPIEGFFGGGLAYTKGSYLPLLEGMRERLLERAEKCRTDKIRQHIPKPGDQVEIGVIDELGALLSYGGDEDQNEIRSLLRLILTQGRAVNFFLWAASQEVTKDIIAVRDLFTFRRAFRLPRAVDSRLVLGDDAVEDGATPHLISKLYPGQQWVLDSREPYPFRVREAYNNNTDLEILAKRINKTPPKPKAQARQEPKPRAKPGEVVLTG